jgi:hypothetical protein
MTVFVVALGLGGAAAGAKKKHKPKGQAWASTATLSHPATNQFAGSVGSKLKACRRDRVVTVTYTDPQTGQTTPLSVQRTDGKGNYHVVLPKDAFFGTYQAHVYKRKIRALKAPQRCRATDSAALAVH